LTPAGSIRGSAIERLIRSIPRRALGPRDVATAKATLRDALKELAKIRRAGWMN